MFNHTIINEDEIKEGVDCVNNQNDPDLFMLDVDLGDNNTAKLDVQILSSM